MNRLSNKLTYANVVASIALFIALAGGTAFAASQFEKESIPTRAFKKESIGPGKLTKAAKAALQGPAGPKGANGAAGPAGPAGPAGAAGSAVAYAHVNSDGTLDAANSKNIAEARQTASPGYYCVTPSVPFHVAIAGGYGGIVGRYYNASLEDPFTSCPDGAIIVEVVKSSGGFVSSPFYIIFD